MAEKMGNEGKEKRVSKNPQTSKGPLALMMCVVVRALCKIKCYVNT
jgi:hypothetical protein